MEEYIEAKEASTRNSLRSTWFWRSRNRLLKAAKKNRGYNVILTRTKDMELDRTSLLHDLALRAEFTERYKADAFFSLHLNSSTNKGLRGYEIFVPFEKYIPYPFIQACQLCAL